MCARCSWVKDVSMVIIFHSQYYYGYVSEGSLACSVCATTRHTGDTGHSPTSTPGLG